MASAGEQMPVNFGKRLAHTDKVVRDRGLKILKKWLQSHQELSRLDYMKVWKGLYFGMWMADKRPVQQELSVNVALLLNDIPREKRNVWIDCFWETMRDAWEKLDVHRINKYLLFMRVILAESFKDLRVGGWQIDEVKGRSEILAQSVPKLTNSAPSVGICIQLMRVLWDELLPQLGQNPKASEEAVMAFLEPFISLAEWSYVDALVRSIHENVIRRAPPELLDVLTKRMLAGAAKADIPKKSREALYDTADELEKAARLQPEIASPLLSEAMAKTAKSKSPSLKANSAPTAKDEQGKKRKGRAKKKAKEAEGEKAKETDDGRLVMSPLMLPKAALPVVHKPASPKKKGKRRSTEAVSTEAKPSEASSAKAVNKKKAKKASAKPGAETTAAPSAQEQPAVSSSGKKGKKRTVSFDLEANKVVKFRERQPVVSGRAAKAAKVKQSTERRTVLRKNKS